MHAPSRTVPTGHSSKQPRSYRMPSPTHERAPCQSHASTREPKAEQDSHEPVPARARSRRRRARGRGEEARTVVAVRPTRALVGRHAAGEGEAVSECGRESPRRKEDEELTSARCSGTASRRCRLEHCRRGRSSVDYGGGREREKRATHQLVGPTASHVDEPGKWSLHTRHSSPASATSIISLALRERLTDARRRGGTHQRGP